MPAERTAAVRVHLPPVLAAVTGGERRMEAAGDTVYTVLESLGAAIPALDLHFFDEGRALRPHIVCIHAGRVVRAGAACSHRVRPGDELILTNALAGG